MSVPIPAIGGIALPPATTATSKASGGGFQDALSNAIQEVEAFSRDAAGSVDRLLSGEGEELHSTILATQRAELSFDLFLQMRNKVVSAYQEIMRMPM